MLGKVVKRRVGGHFVLFVYRSHLQWWPFRVHEIRQLYRKSSNLRDFASRIQLSSKLARKLLDLAEIDYLWRLQKSYLLGKTCSEVAQENGMKLRTLTNLFKDAGISVPRGQRKPQLPTKRLKRIWKKCNSRINRFATTLGVHWVTAKNIYEKIYVAPWEKSHRALMDEVWW